MGRRVGAPAGGAMGETEAGGNSLFMSCGGLQQCQHDCFHCHQHYKPIKPAIPPLKPVLLSFKFMVVLS
jgi:hypothetical protein